MVWLLQPMAPDVEDSRLIVMSSYSAGPFDKAGCDNAVRVVDLMGKAAKVIVFSACIPKSTARLEVEKPKSRGRQA